MRDYSKSAEFLDKPSGLTLAQGPYGGRRAGAALRTGSAPARRPNSATVTFLNGRNSDISKWWTHLLQGRARHLVARIGGVGVLSPTRVPGYAMRTYSGRPSPSIRFSTSAAMATSLACRPSVW